MCQLCDSGNSVKRSGWCLSIKLVRLSIGVSLSTHTNPQCLPFHEPLTFIQIPSQLATQSPLDTLTHIPIAVSYCSWWWSYRCELFGGSGYCSETQKRDFEKLSLNLTQSFVNEDLGFLSTRQFLLDYCKRRICEHLYESGCRLWETYLDSHDYLLQNNIEDEIKIGK